jgi:ATP-binding cassette subfamily C protein
MALASRERIVAKLLIGNPFMLRDRACVDAGKGRKGLNLLRFSPLPADLAAFALAFWRHGRWRAAGAGLLVAGGAVLEGAGLLMLVPVLDLAVRGGARGGVWLARFGPAGSTTRLLALLAAFAALMVLRALVLSRRDRALAHLQTGFVEAVRARLVDRLARAPWSRVNAMSHAALVQALSVEVQQIGIAAHSVVMASVSAMLLLGHGVLAMVLAPVAGGVALACALGGLAISRRGLGAVGRLGQSVTRAHFGVTEGAMGFLSGLKLAAAQGMAQDFAREQHAMAHKAMDDRIAFLRLQSRMREGAAAMGALAGAGMLFAGIALFHLPAPVLVTLLLVLSRMMGPAQAMQQALQQIMHTLPAYARLCVLEQDLSAAEMTGHRPPAMQAPHDGLHLAGVDLAHQGGALVLDGFDLDLPRGAFVGIHGPSGCGKTTLLDLLAGLLPVQAGAAFVLGRRLDEEDALAAHHADLAYAGQEPFLLEGSFRRNLAWSCGAVDDALMWQALEQAEAAVLVRRMGGLDASVGERGSLLSAGERQRLALARAFLRAPRLLLLDEATNAVDMACELRILRRLAAMGPRVTVVFVTHRPESLHLCTHVLRFPGPVLERRGSEGDGDAAHQPRPVERMGLVEPDQT